MNVPLYCNHLCKPLYWNPHVEWQNQAFKTMRIVQKGISCLNWSWSNSTSYALPSSTSGISQFSIKRPKGIQKSKGKNTSQQKLRQTNENCSCRKARTISVLSTTVKPAASPAPASCWLAKYLILLNAHPIDRNCQGSHVMIKQMTWGRGKPM